MLDTVSEEDTTETKPTVLWSLQYQQRGASASSLGLSNADIAAAAAGALPNILSLPEPSISLVFDDGILKTVKEAWRKIIGLNVEEEDEKFMIFEDREVGAYDDYEETAIG